MNHSLQAFLDEAFKPYGEFPARKEVEQELLANLTDKYNDLKAEGKSDDEAYRLTTASFGDIAEIMDQVKPQDDTKTPHKNLGEKIADGINFMMNGKVSRFRAQSLTDSDLANISLIGESFSGSAINGTNFDGSDLTNAQFKATALKDARFVGANLTGANFNGSDAQNVNFDNANLTTATFRSSALKGATFAGARLDGTDFKHSDLTGASFNGLTLRGTIFHSTALKNATFQDATLDSVSFHNSKVKDTNFDGATMDKATYALLKGAKARLDNVTISTL